MKPNPAPSHQAGGSQLTSCELIPKPCIPTLENSLRMQMLMAVSHPTALYEVTSVLHWGWKISDKQRCKLNNWAAIVLLQHVTSVSLGRSLSHQINTCTWKASMSVFIDQRSQLFH